MHVAVAGIRDPMPDCMPEILHRYGRPLVSVFPWMTMVGVVANVCTGNVAAAITAEPLPTLLRSKERLAKDAGVIGSVGVTFLKVVGSVIAGPRVVRRANPH